MGETLHPISAIIERLCHTFNTQDLDQFLKLFSTSPTFKLWETSEVGEGRKALKKQVEDVWSSYDRSSLELYEPPILSSFPLVSAVCFFSVNTAMPGKSFASQLCKVTLSCVREKDTWKIDEITFYPNKMFESKLAMEKHPLQANA